jgi:hypothetical protein
MCQKCGQTGIKNAEYNINLPFKSYLEYRAELCIDCIGKTLINVFPMFYCATCKQTKSTYVDPTSIIRAFFCSAICEQTLLHKQNREYNLNITLGSGQIYTHERGWLTTKSS